MLIHFASVIWGHKNAAAKAVCGKIVANIQRAEKLDDVTCKECLEWLGLVYVPEKAA